MGKIQRYNNRTVIRITVDEILTARVATSKDVTFTLAEMIRKFAQMKAEQKSVKLPSAASSTSFDPSTQEFVVEFFETVDDALIK